MKSDELFSTKITSPSNYLSVNIITTNAMQEEKWENGVELWHKHIAVLPTPRWKMIDSKNNGMEHTLEGPE